MKTMQTLTFHRIWRTFGISVATALVLVLLGTAPARNALAWVYLQSTEAITNATHIHTFSMDTIDPICPQYM